MKVHELRKRRPTSRSVKPLLTLVAGSSTALLCAEVGGRLGQLDLGDGPLLRGPSAGLGWSEWGCYPLLPWSNRLPDGRLRHDGVEWDLPVNSPDRSAIHGLAAACPWVVERHDDRSASLSVVVHGGPYDVSGHLDYVLVPQALDVVLRATNIGDRSVPIGIGIHPWFTAGPVVVPADMVWTGEPLPTGPPKRASGRHDLRSATVPEPMDACFTGLTANTAGAPGVRLRWDGPVTHVVVYSREHGWVCIEPVTMANNGIAMAESGIDGHGVIDLGPGSSIEVRYRFERALGP